MDDKYATKEELKRLEDKMDYHFDKLDTKIDSLMKIVDIKFETVDDKIDARVSKAETHIIEWTIGTAVAIIAVLVAFIH